jgi:ABC-type multidrug transport system ATPase subunit
VDPLIRCEGLVKRFGDLTAVDALSLEVPEGAVCGLLGPNGAGKTTSIRMLLGLAAADAGSIALLGARPGTPQFARAMRDVGALIEGPALYANATARQNMRIDAAALGLSVRDVRIDRLLEMVGLSARAETKVRGFSTGMRQRLGLALALLPEPRLVVLDEPTNGLDPAGIVEIRELIKLLPEGGTTALVSSHLLAEVELMCDRATIIDRGRLVAAGTIAELVSATGEGGFAVAVAASEVGPAIAALQRAGLPAEPIASGRIAVGGGATDGAKVSRALAEAGIYVSELRRTEARLEEVFLSLTDAASGGVVGEEAPDAR